MEMVFEKYQGAGNDFILVDNRNGLWSDITTEEISHLCHRKFGIGSDGLMLLQQAEDADFEMVFFNPDGSRSLCGNGSRCAVIFAERLGLAQKQGQFRTTDGLHRYEILPNHEVAIGMHDCSAPVERAGHLFLNTVSPHLILEVENIDAVDVVDKGRALRYHEHFENENGTNVNFVAPLDVDAYGVRTYERGVEGETLSCGTGVTAVALTMAHKHGAMSPVKLHTHGGTLQVSFQKKRDKYVEIWLQGPAHHVFSGKIDA